MWFRRQTKIFSPRRLVFIMKMLSVFFWDTNSDIKCFCSLFNDVICIWQRTKLNVWMLGWVLSEESESIWKEVAVGCMIAGFRRDIDICTLLRYITQRWVVVLYRRFGTTYRSHLQGSKSPSLLGILDLWQWDRSVVPKRRHRTITELCVIYVKSAFQSL
jgi:hypothetical protein